MANGSEAMATRMDREEYIRATELARAVRARVAEQLHASIVDGDQMADRSELAGALERMLFCERRIAEAVGRQEQARLEGLPRAPAVRAESEFRELLREAVASIAVACARWCASMDYELVREDPALQASYLEDPGESI